jgi:hypothetical protein
MFLTLTGVLMALKCAAEDVEGGREEAYARYATDLVAGEGGGTLRGLSDAI